MKVRYTLERKMTSTYLSRTCVEASLVFFPSWIAETFRCVAYRRKRKLNWLPTNFILYFDFETQTKRAQLFDWYANGCLIVIPLQ